MGTLGTMEAAHRVLQEIFGHREFRGGQADAVARILAGRDTIVLLPTGMGKSACYQVPALVAAAAGLGTTLVISPLIALMDDQVRQLVGRGVPAASLHSHQAADEQHRVLQRLLLGELTLLYVSPERATSPGFRAVLARASVALLAVDEAHCVSQWGHDFRPDYARLAEIVPRMAAPTIALTATATPRVLKEIEMLLALEVPAIIRGGFERPNLSFCVRHPGDEDHREQMVREELTAAGIARRGRGRAIVYCSTRKAVEKVARSLRLHGFPVGYYHAGLTALARGKTQQAFEAARTRVLVATNAFGMGIDIPDIRAVVHFQTPGSLEAYYQEAGRAGRDGAPATCSLLFRPADLELQRRLTNRSVAGASVLAHREAALAKMAEYAQIHRCRQIGLCAHFSEADSHAPCGVCDVCDPRTSEGGEAIDRDRDSPAATPREVELVVGAVAGCSHPLGRTTLARALTGRMTRSNPRLASAGFTAFGCLADREDTAVLAVLDSLVETGHLIALGRGFVSLWLPGKPVVRATAGARKRDNRPKPFRPTAGLHSIAPELDRYRKRMAKTLDCKPHMVLARQAIIAIDRVRPRTIDELRRLPGLGAAKLERFGADLLRLVDRYGRR